MEKAIVSEIVKKLELEKESFEKFHKMTLGISSYRKLYPLSPELKRLNNGKFVMSPLLFIFAVVTALMSAFILIPVIILILAHLTGKKVTKLLKEYCEIRNIDVEVESNGSLLYVRNKMIEISQKERGIVTI